MIFTTTKKTLENFTKTLKKYDWGACVEADAYNVNKTYEEKKKEKMVKKSGKKIFVESFCVPFNCVKWQFVLCIRCRYLNIFVAHLYDRFTWNAIWIFVFLVAFAINCNFHSLTATTTIENEYTIKGKLKLHINNEEWTEISLTAI